MATRPVPDAASALAVAEDLDTDGRLTYGLVEIEFDAIAAAAREIRWLVESRARWQAACYAQQITVYEEDHVQTPT